MNYRYAALALLLPLLATPAAEPTATDLVHRHCGACHQVPDPGILPADSWPYLLDLMGLYFGHDDGNLLANNPDPGVRRRVFDIDRYPDHITLRDSHWQAIRDYFEQAPGAEPAAPPPAAAPLTRFEPVAIHVDVRAPVTSLVKPAATGEGFYLGEARSQALYHFDGTGRLRETAPLDGIAVDLEDRHESRQVTLIGSLLPSNLPQGAIVRSGQGESDPKLILDRLHRPVHSLATDLDGDGDEDLLVSEFGHYVGRFGIHEQLPDGRYRHHILSDDPGALVARPVELTGDDLPDLITLNAQAREQILLYKNRGDLLFERSVLLEQHPGFGYTDLHVIDLEGDGRLELLAVNGDNGDLPGPPLKAYHGLRLYRLDGAEGIELLAFLPMPGAFGAAPADFDGDGDIDIAAVSFFPDPRAPEQRFVYFENLGDLEFRRQAPPTAPEMPWMTIDAGDIDADGDVDILLGNGLLTPPAGSGSRSWPAALLLRNMTVQEPAFEQPSDLHADG